MRTTTTRYAFAVLVTAAAVLASACGGQPRKAGGGSAGDLGFARCDTRPDDCNTGQRGAAGTLSLALPGHLPTLSPLVADPLGDPAGGGNGVSVIMSMIAPSAFVTVPSGAVRYNSDLLAAEPEVVSADPQIVVYKIRAQARWAGGSPISAADYLYNWQLRTMETDCGSPAERARYSRISAVTGEDNGKTVRVTFSAPYPDWRTLFSPLLPAYVAAAAGDITTRDGLAVSCGAWLARPGWSGGPYTVSAYEPEHQVELVTNPEWYGADAGTLEKVVVRCYDDRAAALAALARGEVAAADLPADRAGVAVVRGLARAGVATELVADPGWLSLGLNASGPVLADRGLRQAVLAAVGVREIVEKTARDHFPGAEPRRSHHLAPGRPGYRDIIGQVAPDQGAGNVDTARKLLSDAGYPVVDGAVRTPAGAGLPALRIRFAEGDPVRAEIATLIRDQLTRVGLAATAEPTADLGRTLSAGDFELVLRDEWDGPLIATAIERWATPEAGPLSDTGRPSGAGQPNPTGWRSTDSDDLLRRAAGEVDRAQLLALLNRQDELLTAAAVSLPLYQRPHLLAVAGNYVNIRANATGVLSYNAQQWGSPAA